MIETDEFLEKILKQSQIEGIIQSLQDRDMIIKLNEYRSWVETLFEKYYQESKFNFAQSLKIMEHNEQIAEIGQRIKNLEKIDKL